MIQRFYFTEIILNLKSYYAGKKFVKYQLFKKKKLTKFKKDNK